MTDQYAFPHISNLLTTDVYTDDISEKDITVNGLKISLKN